jgi:hypothetical protein
MTAPFDGYDKLNAKEISDGLKERSQVELAEIEEYERANEDRPAVINKLRYMRRDEPLEGYDAMSAGEVKEALSSADSALVRAVRDYERKFQHRREVLNEAARVLPEAPVNAGEARARKAKSDAVNLAMRTPPPDVS